MRTLSLLLSIGATLAFGGAASSPSITVRSSDYGRILFDGRGKALYAFTRDGRGRSRCSGACATAWPPFLVKRRPSAAGGAKASLVGTVRRSDGRLQVTYGGRALYYYVRGRKPGPVRC